MNIDVTDLTILFIIFSIICYQLYDAKLLIYPVTNITQEAILLAVLIIFNLWITFFVSKNNFSLWTDSKNCIIPCPDILKPLLATRGDNYFLNPEGKTSEKELKSCLLSTWGASHIFMYALITFITPKLWWVVLISGIVWELYESAELGCQDFLDIFWDTLGICIGYHLSKKWKFSSVYEGNLNTNIFNSHPESPSYTKINSPSESSSDTEINSPSESSSDTEINSPSESPSDTEINSPSESFSDTKIHLPVKSPRDTKINSNPEPSSDT